MNLWTLTINKTMNTGQHGWNESIADQGLKREGEVIKLKTILLNVFNDWCNN